MTHPITKETTMGYFKVELSETMKWHGYIEAENKKAAYAKVMKILDENGADAFYQDNMSEGTIVDEVTEIPFDDIVLSRIVGGDEE